MDIPSDLLDRPAPEAARWLALAFLEEVAAARPRLDDPEDTEAVHDFRVALRRLRTCLRVYRDALRDSLTNKVRRRLRGLATASGESRDREVQIGWLRDQEGTLTARERVGWSWLLEYLSDRKAAADEDLHEKVARRFSGLHRKLASRLAVYRVTVRLGDPAERQPTAAGVTGTLLRQLADELGRHLAAVRSLEDMQEAHRARIAAKRLRYTLEPFRRDVGDVETLVKRLKDLQDGLGDLHDAQVFAAVIADALAQAASEHARRLASAVLEPDDQEVGLRRERRRDPRAGLLQLTRRLRARRERTFRALEGEWFGEAAKAFLAQVRDVADRLLRREGAGTETEHKYLLTGKPDVPAGTTARDILQGYLPGTRITDRIRQVRTATETRWYRAVKAGSGLARIEHEEETSHEVFEDMWPLTAGRRIHKRRHEVPDGEFTWQIDEFLDRDLVLAEIEVPSKGTVVEAPDWMRPYIIREVTEDPGYQNVHLAQ